MVLDHYSLNDVEFQSRF